MSETTQNDTLSLMGRLQLTLYRLARDVLPHIPLAISYRLAEWVGDAVWLAARGVRANVEHNQRRALGPDATPREVALSSREVIRNLAKVYVDEFRIPALSQGEIQEAVTIYGLDNLERAHAQGKGIIMVSAHYGAPHVVGQMLRVLGYPTTVVAEHIQPEALFQFMCELRGSHGARLIPIDKPLIGLVRTLRKEEGVAALVVDRNVSGTGIRMPFLGEETTVADGAVQLALRTGAPLLVAYCRRRPDYRYEAFVDPPLALPENPDDLPAAIRDGTARLMARLEQFIREAPGQWLMTVPLWADEPDTTSTPPQA